MPLETGCSILPIEALVWQCPVWRSSESVTTLRRNQLTIRAVSRHLRVRGGLSRADGFHETVPLGSFALIRRIRPSRPHRHQQERQRHHQHGGGPAQPAPSPQRLARRPCSPCRQCRRYRRCRRPSGVPLLPCTRRLRRPCRLLPPPHDHRSCPLPLPVPISASAPSKAASSSSSGCCRVGLVSSQRSSSSEIRSTPMRPARPSRSRKMHSPLPRLRSMPWCSSVGSTPSNDITLSTS